MSASTRTARAGDAILYRIEVLVKNSAQISGVTQAVVTDTLPASVELGRTSRLEIRFPRPA